jgi:hypothetical protein
MRHIKYLNGTRLLYDGAFRCPLVVLGRRPTPELPEKPLKDASEAQQPMEWQAAVRKIRVRQVNGHYSDTVLEWCVDEAEAAKMEEHFKAEGRLDVRTERVDVVPKE